MGSQNSVSSKNQLAPEKQEHEINFINSDNSNQSIEQEDHYHAKFDDFSTDNHPKTINIPFKWAFGGNVVYLTGSFTNWSNHILMNKIINEFQYILALSPGLYEYKFIVDGEWKFSPADSIKRDANGTINNIIDTSKYTKNVEIESSSNSFNNEKKANQNPTLGQVEEEVNDTNLDNEMVKRKAPIPAGQDNNSSKHFDIENFDRVSTHKLFDNEAPIVPPHLIQIPFLIEKKKKINKLWTKIPPHELEDPTEKRIIETLGVFRRFEIKRALTPCFHVTLNHIGCFNNSDNKGNYNIYVITKRFKDKSASLKFYTAK